jgi:hypothetical protein
MTISAPDRAGVYDIADLFDPETRSAALAGLSDADLALAAVAQNETPIYPGQDAKNACENLAELFVHARTPNGAATIAGIACEVLSPPAVCETTASLLGWTATDDMLSRDRSWAEFLLNHPHGSVLLRVALTRMFAVRHSMFPPLFDWTTDILAKLTSLVDDPDALAAAATRASLDHVATAAATRLTKLDATEACDEVFAKTATKLDSYLLRAYHVIPGMSTPALERIVADTSLASMLRERAETHLALRAQQA